MTAALPRRAFAEFVGTGLLVTAVVGSGIAAQRLGHDRGLQLLENALATAAALPVLILVLGPISGAHLNPVVSLADWLLGRRGRSGVTPRDLAAYVPAQVAGAVGGAVLANTMFDVPEGLATHVRTGAPLWLGEIVATAGLLVVIASLARTDRTAQTPWAVGAYIGAASWFTSSTSFANPAITVGRAFSDTFAGVAPASVPGFIVAQLIGGAAGLGLTVALRPKSSSSACTTPVAPRWPPPSSTTTRRAGWLSAAPGRHRPPRSTPRSSR
jgi:glycerol uptake facilitator-like aquaporin